MRFIVCNIFTMILAQVVQLNCYVNKSFNMFKYSAVLL